MLNWMTYTTANSARDAPRCRISPDLTVPYWASYILRTAKRLITAFYSYFYSSSCAASMVCKDDITLSVSLRKSQSSTEQPQSHFLRLRESVNPKNTEKSKRCHNNHECIQPHLFLVKSRGCIHSRLLCYHIISYHVTTFLPQLSNDEKSQKQVGRGTTSVNTALVNHICCCWWFAPVSDGPEIFRNKQNYFAFAFQEVINDDLFDFRYTVALVSTTLTETNIKLWDSMSCGIPVLMLTSADALITLQ